MNNTQNSPNKIYLPDKIGAGYGKMWKSHQRYIVIKGSRRSKKSKTEAQKLIYQIVKYPLAHALVVRRYLNTLHDSCFAELKWAIHNLGLDQWFKCKESPMEIQYIPTGQKIYFRGLDDPLKITSITVEFGVLCFLWIEEAFEIEDEADFDKLEESMLGDLPDGYYKQITLTFNPWSENTWIKSRFFDKTSDDVLAMTTTYMCNEWLSDADRQVFEDMRINRPERYRVSGLGEWGVDGAVFFEEFSNETHVITPFAIPDHWRMVRAIDYGLDALACLYIAIDTNGVAYVVGEVYKSGLIISDAARAIIDGEPRQQKRWDTFAPPDLWSRSKDTGRSIEQTFAENGVLFTKASNDRISGWMQIHERLKLTGADTGLPQARLQIFSNCRNLIRCLSTITTSEKNVNDVSDEPHELTHLPDALRYFCIMNQIVPREPDTRNAEKKQIDDYKKSRFRTNQVGGRIIYR